MKKLLSIGEVSKIKDISIKSLRYYDKIGILKPIYINPNTNYRYYSTEQFLLIDIISIYIELEIPLKHLKDNISNTGDININIMIKNGYELLEKKKQKLNKIESFLNIYSDNITHSDKVQKIKNSYQEYYNKRYFLVEEFDGDLKTYHDYSIKLSKLFIQEKQEGLHSINQGIIIIKNKNITKNYAFLELNSYYLNINNLIITKAGNYTCEIIDGDDFYEFANNNNSITDTSTIISIELLSNSINLLNCTIEVQYLNN